MLVKVKFLGSGIKLPGYQSLEASGIDLSAASDGEIAPKDSALIGTGLVMEIPKGYEGQVRSRSGLALKHKIGMLNSPGTVDSDYRGEISVLLYNHSDTIFYYKKGDRIAQMVFAKVERAVLEEAEILSATVRSGGGFGSTGV